MPNNGGNTVPRIEKSEHIGPDDTGDNIQAKRVANYKWATDGWKRDSTGLVDVPYDDLALTNPDGNQNYQTLTFSASGQPVLTLDIAYDANSNIISIARQ